VSTSFALVAKACGSDEAAENTCAAVAHALAAPLPPWARLVIEVDVRLTGDGALVAMHDASLDRTTTGTGAVRGARLSHIRALRTRDGESIPLLEEVVEAVGERELVVELHDGGAEVLDALLRTLARFGPSPRARLMIASEDSRLIHRLRQRAPALSTAASAREAWQKLALERLRLDAWAPRGHTWIVPERHRGLAVVTSRFIESAQAAGDEVWIYLVNDHEQLLRLRGSGIAGSFTTRPHQLGAALLAV
jgi:glycerophosphoryl diester phosphodiesterase